MEAGKLLLTTLVTLFLSLGSFSASRGPLDQPLSGFVPVPAEQNQTAKPVPVTAPLSPDTRQGVSSNWSGYGATGGDFTGVSGTWVVPIPSPEGRFAAEAAWVGIGGITDSDLIQAGTQATISPNGQVNYQAFYEVLPEASRPLPVSVRGGDMVMVSVVQQSPGQWKISFKNNTTGKSHQFIQSYDSSLSSAEWVEEAPSSIRRLIPLANFGMVNFSNCTAIRNGQTVNIKQSNAQAISMGLLGQLLATPSGLGNDGASFTITRTDARVEQTPPRRISRPTLPDENYY